MSSSRQADGTLPAPRANKNGARGAKLIRLTDRGWAVHEAASEIVTALQDAWARRLGVEKMERLRQLLRELIASLEDQGPPGAETAAREVEAAESVPRTPVVQAPRMR